MNNQNLAERIDAIERRNRRVELDKAWETSWTRRSIIAVLTYVVIALFFRSAGIREYWLHAIVPTLAFILSTLSMNVFKRIWIKWQRTKGN